MLGSVVPTMVRLGIVLGSLGVMFGMSTEVYRWDVSVGWCVYVWEYEVECWGCDEALNATPRSTFYLSVNIDILPISIPNLRCHTYSDILSLSLAYICKYISIPFFPR